MLPPVVEMESGDGEGHLPTVASGEVCRHVAIPSAANGGPAIESARKSASIQIPGRFPSSSLPYQNFGVPPLALQGPHQTTHEIALLAVERVCSAVASAVLRLHLAPRKEDFANELILLA